MSHRAMTARLAEEKEADELSAGPVTIILGGPDQKPPRLQAGESETLHGLLQYQRDSLVRKVARVGEVDALRSPVASGTSLLWLITHMARGGDHLGALSLRRTGG